MEGIHVVDVDLLEPATLDRPDLAGTEAFVVAHAGAAFLGATFVAWPTDTGAIADEIDRRLHDTLTARAVTDAVGDRRAWTPPPSPPTTGIAVSVVVCTVDRLVKLRRCLCAIRPQLGPEDELIVVDNSASGSARGLADAYGARWVPEHGRGSSWARNRGVASATRDVVVFLDDDCVPDRAWLDAIRSPFGDADVDAVTAGVLARRAGLEVPTLIDERQSFHRGWSPRRFQGSTETPLSPYDAWVVGTGGSMAWRRQVLLALGGFDPALGAGTPMGAGEELDAFRTLLARGGVIMYEPSALVCHDHPETLRQLRRKLLQYAIGTGAQLAKVALEDRTPGALRRAASSTALELRWHATTFRREVANLATGRRRMPLLASLGEPFAIALGAARFVRHRRRVRGAPSWR